MGCKPYRENRKRIKTENISIKQIKQLPFKIRL